MTLHEIIEEIKEMDRDIRFPEDSYEAGQKDAYWSVLDLLTKYLEKQKEPTKEELYAEAGTTEKEYVANMMKKVRAMREKLKEQKPVDDEWLKKYNDKVNEEIGSSSYNVKDCAKPAEWSEEDEEVIQAITEELHKRGFTFLADYVTRLRPSWKPSEEQIDALEETISQDCTVCNGDRKWIKPNLESLYEQLKAL